MGWFFISLNFLWVFQDDHCNLMIHEFNKNLQTISLNFNHISLLHTPYLFKG